MRKGLTVICILLLAGLAALLLTRDFSPSTVDALDAPPRTLLRLWVTSAPGGAVSWLEKELRAFEKQHPGVMTYLRQVSKEELNTPGAVLPDVLLTMPGDVTDPAALLSPLIGEVTPRESLLPCGQQDGVQYSLPLCWGAWVLAINSAYDKSPAQTPAPTTLLGRPATTSPPLSTEVPYPIEAISAAKVPLLSPGGCALIALSLVLPTEERPPVTESFAHLDSAEVYRQFQRQDCASAMLTTGQITAFSGIVSGGKGFAFRVKVPGEIATDQVLLASIVQGAPVQAAELLAFLTSREAQEHLSAQGLFPARDDMSLYVSGWAAQVEQAARVRLTVPHAFSSRESVDHLAWRVWQGQAPAHFLP